MARITLGIGISHGPMLSVASELWADRVPADRLSALHPFRGKTYSFDELVELRKPEGFQHQITPEVMRERHHRCQAAIASLAEVFETSRPDVGILVGNDQMEVFTEDGWPSLAIFSGEYVEGEPRSPEYLSQLPPGIAPAEIDRTPEQYTRYPCIPELGDHLIRSVVADGFDVAQLRRLPVGPLGSNTAPHAYGFVYRRLMRDKVIPHVPIFINTFYPPNQPTAKRCFDFGKSLGRAIRSWPSDKKFVLIASGGLSHFVIDEDFDRKVIEALKDGSAERLTEIPEAIFQSGTSEVKNWITAAGALQDSQLVVDVVDYVPCYRSEAGTGTAHAFVVWR